MTLINGIEYAESNYLDSGSGWGSCRNDGGVACIAKPAPTVENTP